MSQPTHVLNVQIVTNGNMATSIGPLLLNSLPINLDINEIVSYSIQAEFTGTPSGVLQLVCSNDVPVVGPPVNWTIVTDSTQGITAAGTYVVNVEFPAYSWVALEYIPTAGSGTLNARINAKRR